MNYPGTPPKPKRWRFMLTSFRALAMGRPPLDPGEVTLKPASGTFRPLRDDDIPLIVVSHNEGRFVRSFLDHYRSLGVTRFLWVDDSSNDGTQDLLRGAPDVDLHISNVRYGAAERGRLWRRMLVSAYGEDRWYVSVDADEFLVYRDHAMSRLDEVIRSLEARGIRRMAAPMIDLYPPGAVAQAAFPGTGDAMPWSVASLFDASGYTIRPGVRAWHLSGGVRDRVFGSRTEMMKYPLMYWDRRTHFPKSVHDPAPYSRNYTPPMGCLLHFKFFSDFSSRFEYVVSSGQHYQGGEAYKHILSRLEGYDLVLEGDVSARYLGAEDLYARGFIGDWRN